MDKEQQVDLALARAVIYESLAEGFAPPAVATLDRIASPAGSATIAKAAELIDAGGQAALGEAVRSIPLGASLPELGKRYAALFGHTARGEVPPYETEYGEDDIFRQPQELADLSGFFRAFGARPDLARRDRCDHVSCECEFLSWLSLKQAWALEHEDAAMLAEVGKARRLFLRDHLGSFAPAFGRRLARADEGGFYGALGAMLERFVLAECRSEDVPAGPSYLKLRDPEPADVPLACGESCEMAESCAAFQGTASK